MADAFPVIPVPKDRERDAETVPVPLPVFVAERKPVFSPLSNRIMSIFMITNPALLNDFDEYNDRKTPGA